MKERFACDKGVFELRSGLRLAQGAFNPSELVHHSFPSKGRHWGPESSFLDALHKRIRFVFIWGLCVAKLSNRRKHCDLFVAMRGSVHGSLDAIAAFAIKKRGLLAFALLRPANRGGWKEQRGLN